MPPLSDEALMQQAAAGHTENLAVLFDRHHRKLLTFFVKLGHARSSGEDLVQDTFLRMLRYAKSFRADARFVPWMYQIARNAASDAYHARPHEEPYDHEALDRLGHVMPESPDTIHGLNETEQRLQRALSMLARDKRELVLLSRVRQLGTDDLASLFGCSANAVKVRLHRSLEELRVNFDALELATTNMPHQAKQVI